MSGGTSLHVTPFDGSETKMNVQIDGSTVSFTKNGKTTVLKHATEEQARAAAWAIRECEERPWMNLLEFVAVWDRGHAVPRLCAASLSSCRSTLRKHVLPYLGDLSVRNLDRDGLLRYLNDCASDAGCYRKVTPSAQRLQAVLAKAQQWGLIDTNPMMEIDGLFLGGKPSGLVDRAA
jgi:hypothetical protein